MVCNFKNEISEILKLNDCLECYFFFVSYINVVESNFFDGFANAKRTIVFKTVVSYCIPQMSRNMFDGRLGSAYLYIPRVDSPFFFCNNFVGKVIE